MKGVLKKQGEGWTFGAPFWRERYFKEDSANARIAYYKSINEVNPQGFIDYSTITEVVPRADNFGYTNMYGFEIRTSTRVYNLVATTESEQLAWINAISKKINQKTRYISDTDEWINQMKMAQRSVLVTFENKTPHTLRRLHYKLHGHSQTWKMFPPEEIKPNETVKFGSCSTTLISGTRASVTFTVDGLELEKDLWFRWENPYRKIAVSKQALFDAPAPFMVEASQDVSASHTFIPISSDFYQIKYTITAPGNARGSSNVSSRDTIESKEQKSSPSPPPQAAQLHATTVYHTADWMQKLKAAHRSVLVTIENHTDRDFERTEWDLPRGMWRFIPMERLPKRSNIQFGTESNGLGFDVGTWGKVVYVTHVAGKKDADTIVTLNWANTLIWGINFGCNLTTSTNDTDEIVVDLEEKKERAAEVIFRIFDSDRAAGASDAAMTAAPVPVVATTAAVNIKGSTPPSAAPTPRAVRRTIVQEDGVLCSKTFDFQKMRKEAVQDRKTELSKARARLDMICYEIVTHIKSHQDIASSFFSLFKDDEEIPLSIMLQDKARATSCPLNQYKFKSDKEKVNCQLCGRVVCAMPSCSQIVPFPNSYAEELKDLKNVPKGLRVCSEDARMLEEAMISMQWRDIKDKCRGHPIIACFKRLSKVCNDIKASMSQLARSVSTQSPDAIHVARKIELLFKEMDETREDIAKLAIYKGNMAETTSVANLLEHLECIYEKSMTEFELLSASLPVPVVPPSYSREIFVK